jgi:hypothetical protein
MVTHACNPSYTGGISKRTVIHGQPLQKHMTLSEKIAQVKRAVAVA